MVQRWEKPTLSVAKMHLNVIEDYLNPVARIRCRWHNGNEFDGTFVADGIMATNSSNRWRWHNGWKRCARVWRRWNWTNLDIHRTHLTWVHVTSTCFLSWRNHFEAFDFLRWHLCYEKEGRSDIVINDQHFTTGNPRLLDFWKKIINFASDYIKGI